MKNQMLHALADELGGRRHHRLTNAERRISPAGDLSAVLSGRVANIIVGVRDTPSCSLQAGVRRRMFTPLVMANPSAGGAVSSASGLWDVLRKEVRLQCLATLAER